MATKKSKKKSASQVQDTPVLVHGFKGFDRNWQCRGKQYAPNSSHEELEAKLCDSGLHFCEHPLDCFGYYAPGNGSVYAEVSAENPTEEKGDDTKRVTKKLHIGAELTLSSLTQAALKFVFDRATWVDGDKATGYQGAASATGDRGAASATGNESVALSTGYMGRAKAASGSWIVLAERDDNGHILGMRCAKIDGEVLKPNIFYTLLDGEFVEAKD